MKFFSTAYQLDKDNLHKLRELPRPTEIDR